MEAGTSRLVLSARLKVVPGLVQIRTGAPKCVSPSLFNMGIYPL